MVLIQSVTKFILKKQTSFKHQRNRERTKKDTHHEKHTPREDKIKKKRQKRKTAVQQDSHKLPKHTQRQPQQHRETKRTSRKHQTQKKPRGPIHQILVQMGGISSNLGPISLVKTP